VLALNHFGSFRRNILDMTDLPLRRSFKDKHDVEIVFWEWPVADPKAVVQLVHGIGEHSRRYDHVAKKLNSLGYAVYSDDHRGHGQTGKGMVAAGITKKQGLLGPGGMDAVLAEVRQLTELMKSEHPSAKLVMIGHSWGSMLAQRLYDKHSSDLSAFVLSGSSLLIPGIINGGKLNKKWAHLPNATGGEWLSRDLEVGRKFREDPLNFVESFAQVVGLVDTLKLMGAPKKTINPNVPILIQAGSDDSLAGERGNVMLANAYRKRGVDDIVLFIYEGARHEIYNETNKDEVLNDLATWLEAHI
jgi:alpha-beta hydrolase superfamily lysophospholipase